MSPICFVCEEPSCRYDCVHTHEMARAKAIEPRCCDSCGEMRYPRGGGELELDGLVSWFCAECFEERRLQLWENGEPEEVEYDPEEERDFAAE